MSKYYSTFSTLFSVLLPELFHHFSQLGLRPDLFLLDWIMTIFARWGCSEVIRSSDHSLARDLIKWGILFMDSDHDSCCFAIVIEILFILNFLPRFIFIFNGLYLSRAAPLDVTCRIWDVLMRDGEDFLFRAAFGILSLYEVSTPTPSFPAAGEAQVLSPLTRRTSCCERTTSSIWRSSCRDFRTTSTRICCLKRLRWACEGRPSYRSDYFVLRNWRNQGRIWKDFPLILLDLEMQISWIQTSCWYYFVINWLRF